jgi:methylmalonyl-CoA/ethylmalonyl-CoA epimerase
MSFYSDVLGMAVHPLGNSDGARITGFTAGDALVELLEPAVDESPIGKFIAKRGPGIHHVCFVVDDLATVLERCRDAGIRLIDEEPRIGAEGKPIAFLHPSSTGGVLIELTEQ